MKWYTSESRWYFQIKINRLVHWKLKEGSLIILTFFVWLTLFPGLPNSRATSGQETPGMVQNRIFYWKIQKDSVRYKDIDFVDYCGNR